MQKYFLLKVLKKYIEKYIVKIYITLYEPRFHNILVYLANNDLNFIVMLISYTSFSLK